MPTPPEIDWLPILPDARPRRVSRVAEWTETVEPFEPGYTPSPDILAALAFFPSLDTSPEPRRVRPKEPWVIVEPFDTPTRIAPGVWLPILAGPLPRPARPRIERVVIDPTFGAALQVAAWQSWTPVLTAQARSTRSVPMLAESASSDFITAAAPPPLLCVDLLDGVITVPLLVTEAVVVSDLIAEDLTSPIFLAEGLCL